MHFFRNPEIKHAFVLQIGSMIFFTAAGFLFGFFFLTRGRFFRSDSAYFEYSFPLRASLISACFAFLISLSFVVLHLLITFRRYRRIRLLCQEIDQALHGEAPVHFSDYREGELAILKIEIDKLLVRLTEQSEALRSDKQKLAASLADISHQIRTPLTSIRLVLSLLTEPNLSESKRRELVHQLSRLISRIDWLIEALLKLSRLDAGTVVLKPENVPVAKLVAAAAEPLAIAMELRGQQFSFTPQTHRESFIGDFSWTAEALGNILKNCMEHTPFGGRIQVSAAENTIFTEIIIEDDGPGFAAQDLPHLFERFYKGADSDQESVGIGLALSRIILARQNATIKAENRLGGGARFILHFYPPSDTV